MWEVEVGGSWSEAGPGQMKTPIEKLKKINAKRDEDSSGRVLML
jgi:hypothetical protein